MNYYKIILPHAASSSHYAAQRSVGIQGPSDMVLAVNRQFAGALGLDPRYTISSNIALIVSRATGMTFTTTKRLFHAGVAGFMATLLSMFGPGMSAVFGAGALCWAWLESFDSSAHRR